MSFRNVSATTLQDWIAEGNVRLVDVREYDEFSRVRIRDAECKPLSRFEPMDVTPASDDERIVVVCRTGRRSATAAERLADAGFRNVFNLDGGMAAWQSNRLDVVVDRSSPISLMRQVQIAVGTMVLGATILGATVSPWFLLLSGFAGAGLMVAGLTDTCAMAMALDRMPWNRRRLSAKPAEATR